MRLFCLAMNFALLCIFISCSSHAREVLTVGLVHDNVNERYLILELEEEFELRAPHIDIQAVGVHTNQYKYKVIDWLKQEAGPDIFFWYGSERLKEFVRNGWVSPIDDIWASHSLSSAYQASVIDQVKEGTSYFGIPVSYYSWSLFFNQTLFQKHDLEPPQTWEAFLNVCETLHNKNIIPIAIGYRAPWTLTAWFELLNLRLHGAQFHNAVLSGTVAYTDPRIRDVFQRWKLLIDKGYFQENGDALDWEDPMTYLYREVAGMTLIGHFFSSRIPSNLKERIGLFSSPELVPGQARVELAPLDVFFIRASSSKQKYAMQFLSYLTSIEAQVTLNRYTGGFTPMLGAPPSVERLDEAGAYLLKQASATSPYFDRAVPTNFSEPAMLELKAFMLNPDVERVTTALEALRQAKYSDK